MGDSLSYLILSWFFAMLLGKKYMGRHVVCKREKELGKYPAILTGHAWSTTVI